MTRPFTDPTWSKIVDVWGSGQFQLGEVMRYSRYLREDPGLMRPQTTLQHSYVVTLVGSMLCQLLNVHSAKINEALLLRSLLVHDHGEGELRRDVLYINKSGQDDLDEYFAFVQRFEPLDPVVFEPFHRAYLLDFARTSKLLDRLPPEAQRLIRELKLNEWPTVMAFYAVERWDYVLHAVFHYQTFGYTKLLVQVLRNQASHLDRIAEELAGFREEVWTYEVRQWCMDLLAEHEGQFIEQKG